MEGEEVGVGHPTAAPLAWVGLSFSRGGDGEAEVSRSGLFEIGRHNFIPAFSDTDSDEGDDGCEEGPEANVIVVDYIASFDVFEEL